MVEHNKVNVKLSDNQLKKLKNAFKNKTETALVADLSKQKALDANSRAIKQMIFTGKASANVVIYYILEKWKEAILEFLKGTTKVL